jgi:hypothetical protein
MMKEGGLWAGEGGRGPLNSFTHYAWSFCELEGDLKGDCVCCVCVCICARVYIYVCACVRETHNIETPILCVANARERQMQNVLDGWATFFATSLVLSSRMLALVGLCSTYLHTRNQHTPRERERE